jgi:hypothetical protein
MRVGRSSVVAVGLLYAVAGCADVQKSLEDAKQQVSQAVAPTPAAAPPADVPPGPNIGSTPLFHLFTNAPYDTTKPFDGQYPRVALTILSSPPNHNQLWQYTAGAHGCWTIGAVLWRSKTAPETVTPFVFCVPQDMTTGIPLAFITDWAGRATLHVSDTTTGNKRTEGPLPPSNPFPTDPAHQMYFAGGHLDSSAMDGAMFGGLLYKMGFDWSNGADRRVWIVKFVAAGQ